MVIQCNSRLLMYHHAVNTVTLLLWPPFFVWAKHPFLFLWEIFVNATLLISPMATFWISTCIQQSFIILQPLNNSLLVTVLLSSSVRNFRSMIHFHTWLVIYPWGAWREKKQNHKKNNTDNDLWSVHYKVTRKLRGLTDTLQSLKC